MSLLGSLLSGGGSSNDKGYFVDQTALETAYPTGEAGWYAVVGSTDTIWIWDTATVAWLNSGSSELGTMSTQDADSVAITGGTISDTVINQKTLSSTLSGNLSLTATSANTLFLNPNGADRDIIAEATPANGRTYYIYNSGSANFLVFKNNGSTQIFSGLPAGFLGVFKYNGTAWVRTLLAYDEITSDKLIGFSLLDQQVATTSNVTFASSTLSNLTASELAASDADKKIVSLSVATYPSLTEISYSKGVTSAIQTQLNAKANLATVNTFTKAQSVTPAVLNSSSGSVAIDGSLSNYFTHTLTENTTFALPTNLVFGTRYTFKIIQNASTPYTLGFNAAFLFHNNRVPVINTQLSSVTMLEFVYYSSSQLFCTSATNDVEILTEATTSRTLALTDAGNIIEFTSASDSTVTVPLNATVPFRIGTIITLDRVGAGNVTVAPVSGSVTIDYAEGLKISAQNKSATLIKSGTDSWKLRGALAA